jgi:Asp-tRNA(Asn)/Glu-tRNA(Gln) amidotransferase A subunit family amidase
MAVVLRAAIAISLTVGYRIGRKPVKLGRQRQGGSIARAGCLSCTFGRGSTHPFDHRSIAKVTDLARLTAIAASKLLASGEITSQQLTQACLDRIAAREPEIKAFAHLDPEYALQQARAADEARRSGRGVGPLHGLPVGIKDIIDTADMPTQNGCEFFKGRQPKRDAACVRSLREAGAIIIGKTVTTEMASTHPGPTRNPHNTGHTPGGSSSGSAAGIADFMFPLALGTQTGGSVIRPASFCGIYGLKPTFGLIPRTGVTMQSHTLDTVGVYGRSVEDLALIADALSAHDPDDSASYPRSRPDLLRAATEQPPVKPLFAYVKTPMWHLTDDVAKDAFAELVAELGSLVEEIEIPSLEAVVANHAIVMAAENAGYYGNLADRAGDAISASLRARIEDGRKVSAETYIKAVNAREAASQNIDAILMNYSAILTPASTGRAPKTLASTGNPIFNAPWTYLGQPCVTLPLLEADGLPIGVQLIGGRRDDGRLLRTARWLALHLDQSA